ncbi:MAG: DUF2251 domain-containing protein [Phycisphaerales bacterium]|nr:MAG: DUF2251 domain-containing protein [Phycisphaerales bacterium]
MAIKAGVNEEFRVGDAWFASVSPKGDWAVVFEDDGETAYLYATRVKADGSLGGILDALHIYNVAQVTDKEKPSRLVLGWSRSGEAAVCLINGYPHAIYDMGSKRATNRTGFPPIDKKSPFSRDVDGWDPTLENAFK